MNRYRTRKVYEERMDNYVRNYHINQVRELDENAVQVAAPEPVSKDRLKNKNKQRQEPIAQIDVAVNDAGEPVKAVLRPLWKVNAKYTPANNAYRLRLSPYNKAYERDSM